MANVDVEKERKQFEEWAAEVYGGNIDKYIVRHEKFPDEYRDADIQWAWKAWHHRAELAHV